jgi:hypothetical protein
MVGFELQRRHYALFEDLFGDIVRTMECWIQLSEFGDVCCVLRSERTSE